MLVHLDPLGGIAGDMFLAACIDTWPELAAGVEEAMRAGGLPPTWRLDVFTGASNGLAGRRVTLVGPDPDEDHIHHGDHTGEWRRIRASLESSDLDPPVKDRAIDIFTRLAAAEAAVHGVAVDDVHFHELADWDSIADIVGAAWCIEQIGAQDWSVGPLPIGSGTITTNHGPLPVPAPAVARLLRGLEVVDDGIAGERVTPTGAAIIAHLEPRPGPRPRGRMGPTGTGLGTRSLPDRANALRILTIETRPEVGTPVRPWDVGSVTVIGFDIDDQSPEDLAVALEQLRTTDGVVDVVQHPVAAKKGRLGVHVRILCRPDARDQVISVCFDQTTTIGLRWRDESRAELERLAVSHGDIDGKAVVRPDGSVTSKPEVDSIAAVAVTRSQRDLTRIRFQAETELES